MLKVITQEMYNDLCHWVLSSKEKYYLYIKGKKYMFMSLTGTENGSHCVDIFIQIASCISKWQIYEYS